MMKLPVDLIEIVNDYRLGSETYWRYRYNAVISEIRRLRFFVYTEWSNNDCNVCPYNISEMTVELTFDKALEQYNVDLHHTINNTCGCRIMSSKIYLVNDHYYNAISNDNDDSDTDGIDYYDYYNMFYNYRN